MPAGRKLPTNELTRNTRTACAAATGTPRARSSRIQRQTITARSTATRASTAARCGSDTETTARAAAAMSMRVASQARIAAVIASRVHHEPASLASMDGYRPPLALRATKVSVSNRFLRILKSSSVVPV